MPDFGSFVRIPLKSPAKNIVVESPNAKKKSKTAPNKTFCFVETTAKIVPNTGVVQGEKTNPDVAPKTNPPNGPLKNLLLTGMFILKLKTPNIDKLKIKHITPTKKLTTKLCCIWPNKSPNTDAAIPKDV